MQKTTSHEVKFQSVNQQIREYIQAQMRGATLAMVYELFNQEVDRMCGPVFSRKGSELAHRAGSDPGSILAQGQRLAVKKPRVKKAGQEVELSTYAALQGYDILSKQVQAHMLAGVSTRDYDAVLDEISGGLGLSKSSVSEAFVRASKGALDELNSRDLSQFTFVSIMVDGVGFGERTVVAALGITTKGQKLILGLREGETENWEIVRDLFESLIARGLRHDQKMLFVIDGGKALKKAILKIFGSMPIQRCIRHKERNIIKYLPEERHIEFRRRWKLIHAMGDWAAAKKEYDALVHWLGSINHAALDSLEEAQGETLTVIKLNVPPALRKSLLSTNAIESMFSIQKPKVSRVKNWRSGPNQVLRWAATTLLDAEKRFHRVRGHLYITRLVESLKSFGIEKQTEVA
jgi:putative transposase